MAVPQYLPSPDTVSLASSSPSPQCKLLLRLSSQTRALVIYAQA